MYDSMHCTPKSLAGRIVRQLWRPLTDGEVPNSNPPCHISEQQRDMKDKTP